MKTKLTYAIVIALAVLFTNCKKENQVNPGAAAKEDELAAAPLTALGVPQNSVITVAGSPYTTGPTLVNATGKNARFSGPKGIQLMDDGTIYVADSHNNVIRKVSPSAVVTTFNVPKAGDPPLFEPYAIGIAKSGIVNILDKDINEGFSEGRIYNPNGTLNFSETHFYGIYYGLAKDPYEDVFWFNSSISTLQFKKNTEGSFGVNRLTYTNDFLPESSNAHPSFNAVFAGYNKVIYFAFENLIYKHTPSNIGAQIYPSLGYFEFITSFVLNKDSHTIYVADAGYIKRIDDGRLTIIAGPSKTFSDSRDGVGFKADVHAYQLALSKDESTLYFSDMQANAIRKIVLR
jgi:DNA-binding beta-propeller fold protein YncE